MVLKFNDFYLFCPNKPVNSVKEIRFQKYDPGYAFEGKSINSGMKIRFWPKKSDPGLCTSNEGRFLIVYFMNILDNFKSILFCFNTFGVRRTKDVLDSENQPGSG